MRIEQLEGVVSGFALCLYRSIGQRHLAVPRLGLAVPHPKSTAKTNRIPMDFLGQA